METRGRKPTHGESKRVCRDGKPMPEWRVWAGMWSRCGNPTNRDYHKYGGRGIAVCDRWRDYEAFLADMGRRPSRRHTLDRKDNNGPYSPDNCRWATPKEQASNRRDTVYLTVNGETLPRAVWADRYGISISLIDSRMRKGWSADRAVTEPIRMSRRAA